MLPIREPSVADAIVTHPKIMAKKKKHQHNKDIIYICVVLSVYNGMTIKL